MSYYNRDRALKVGDGFIATPAMGASLRAGNISGWSVWACVLDNLTVWSTAVTDDFGNLVAVKS